MNDFADRLKTDKLKIAIVLDEMSIGGIPKACIPFMKELAKYGNVTLILQSTEGALQSEVPDNIRVVCVPKYSTKDIITYLLKNRHYISAICYAVMHIIYGHVTKRWVKSWMISANYAPCIIEDNFDCVIAYHGMNIAQLCRTVYQMKARKKVAWIHGDHPFNGIHKSDAEKLYGKFEKICCVSKDTKDKFDNDFPLCASLTEVFYNLFNVDEIKEKSNEYKINMDERYLNIVTVGRISREKGQDMIPLVVDQLIKNNVNVRWYIVGAGADRGRVESIIKQSKTSEKIIFTGGLLNPYPYIKACDIYVQPSYTEGYPLSIFEAAILGKAIVATNVGGTHESFVNSKDIILTDVSPEALASGIEFLKENPNEIDRMEENIVKYNFSNNEQVEKLLNWISS